MAVAKRSSQSTQRKPGSAPVPGRRRASVAPGRRAAIPKLGGPLTRLAALWPGVVFQQRPDLTFASISPAIEAVTGVPARDWLHGPPRFWDVVHELDSETVRQHVAGCAHRTEVQSLPFRVRNLTNGHVHYILERRRAVWDGRRRLAGYEGLWLDQTQQITAELRLASAGWKETLAVLTMGLAHDFNNILAGICSLSDTCLMQITPTHEFHESLALIHRNAQQASELVHRIVRVHRSQVGSRSYHDLNEITGEAIELMRKVIPRYVEFTPALAAASLPLYVDAVEFRQVIINLTLNAVDAMPERGHLRFETALRDALPPHQHAAGSPPRMPCGCFTISDTGSGIKPRHLASLFDPFFTTKAMNKGSGLGLYNARLFAEKHQGWIGVQSAAGTGTTFHVCLPQADFTEAEHCEQQWSRRRRSLLLVGTETEPRAAMAEFLRLHNFQVFAIAQGAEEWLQSGEHGFDAVILQADSQEGAAPAVIRLIRQNQLPVKVVLQILGCHPDRMETQFLFNADLVLTPDQPEADILANLQSLLDPSRNSG